MWGVVCVLNNGMKQHFLESGTGMQLWVQILPTGRHHELSYCALRTIEIWCTFEPLYAFLLCRLLETMRKLLSNSCSFWKLKGSRTMAAPGGEEPYTFFPDTNHKKATWSPVIWNHKPLEWGWEQVGGQGFNKCNDLFIIIQVFCKYSWMKWFLYLRSSLEQKYVTGNSRYSFWCRFYTWQHNSCFPARGKTVPLICVAGVDLGSYKVCVGGGAAKGAVKTSVVASWSADKAWSYLINALWILKLCTKLVLYGTAQE